MALRGHSASRAGGHMAGLLLHIACAPALAGAPSRTTGTWSTVPELTSMCGSGPADAGATDQSIGHST